MTRKEHYEQMIETQRIKSEHLRNSLLYKILELMRETHANKQDYLTLDELEDIIKEIYCVFKANQNKRVLF